MKNEIDVQSRFTEYENERLLVQITGTNGTPIHYEESFKNAEREHNDTGSNQMRLHFNNGRSYDGDGSDDLNY
jgi:hypothetical protein